MNDKDSDGFAKKKINIMNKKVDKVVYILTNPSFPSYVKIGYADDIDKRLKELNRSECIPYAFRLYAYCKVEKRLTDLAIHRLIDTINRDLRCIEEFEGKTRRREFYAMSADDAYLILEAIASFHGLEENLILVKKTDNQLKDEEKAENIRIDGSMPRLDWMIDQGLVKIGDKICVKWRRNDIGTLIGGLDVEYKSKIMSLNSFAKIVTGSKHINAYKNIIEIKSKKTLLQIRENGMKKLGMVKSFCNSSNEKQEKISEVTNQINGLKNSQEFLHRENISYNRGNRVDFQENKKNQKQEQYNNKRYSRSLPKMDWLIKQGLIKIGDEICTPLNPQEIAVIFDDRNVEYNGKVMSLNQYAQKIYSHVKAICAYKYVRKVGSKETFHEIRAKRMKELGMNDE